MRGYLFEMFSVSLILTILAELTVAYVCARMNAWAERKEQKCRSMNRDCRMRVRLPAVSGKYGFLLVVLVNVLTNPPAVLLCCLGRMYLSSAVETAGQLAVEAAVVSVEAWIYRSFAKEYRWGIRRPVALSVTANLCSWLSGVILLAVRNA